MWGEGKCSLNWPVRPCFIWLQSITGHPPIYCKQCAHGTPLKKILPSIYNYQTQTDQYCLSSNPCSRLIAQLCYKGHPGVAASRSRPLPSPWWSPAFLMSLSCLCILNISLTLCVCVRVCFVCVQDRMIYIIIHLLGRTGKKALIGLVGCLKGNFGLRTQQRCKIYFSSIR